ncbi:MAG: metallophosphoesterase family protein, partial [Lentisphaeria bacterium]|nr:metallophosphoesterase family protein [Lentisphaeria bacterium]
YVNGKEVMSNFPKGNYGSYYNRFCYVFPVSLCRGKNLLALRTRSGSGSWQLGVGLNPFVPVEDHSTELFSRRAIINAILIPRGRVTRGPFIPRLSAESAVISFQADGLMPAGVEYREKGTSRWLRQMDAAGAQVRSSLDSHMVTLSGLKPGTVYQYRIVMFPSREGKPVFSEKEYFFKTFDSAAERFRFVLTADTQIPYLAREKTIKKILDIAGRTDLPLAFAAHLGDMNNECSNFELEVLRTMELFSPLPIVFARGNHEYVGAETGEWNNYFAPDGKSYFAFRHGKVFFIVLDSGNNFPSRYGDLNPTLIREQRKWLEEIVRTPECRTADFRIVMSHHTNPSDPREAGQKLFGLNKNMHQLADGILMSENPKCRIHLWLAGHTHSFLRTTPCSHEYRKVDGYKMRDAVKTYSVKRYPYTILTGEYGRKNNSFTGITVDVLPDSLKVDTFLPDGTVLDSFRVRKDGSVENLQSHPGIRIFPVRRQK